MLKTLELTIVDEGLKERFWSKVCQGNSDECWEWNGGLFEDGYGQFGINRKVFKGSLRSHRVAYYLTYNADPGDLLVCHSCDNPPCCNPNHLFLGTHLDNQRDKKRKGRAALGEKCANSKLTEMQILEIRERYSNGERGVKLGEEFECSSVNIADIVAGRTWPHIEGPRTKPVVGQPSRFSPAVVNEMHQFRCQGRTFRSIADHYGCAPSVVYNALRRASLT